MLQIYLPLIIATPTVVLIFCNVQMELLSKYFGVSEEDGEDVDIDGRIIVKWNLNK
jgi:hypothetical protein